MYSPYLPGEHHLHKIQYTLGEVCPNAEKYGVEALNLPPVARLNVFNQLLAIIGRVKETRMEHFSASC
jgi:hypothetical protein